MAAVQTPQMASRMRSGFGMDRLGESGGLWLYGKICRAQARARTEFSTRPPARWFNPGRLQPHFPVPRLRFRRYFDLFLRWMIARDFAVELANLKALVERAPAPAPVQA
jgi:hypothetical protein